MDPSRLTPALELPLPALAGTPEKEDQSAESIQRDVLALFDAHAPGLHRYVGSFNLGRDATEDVVQEIFVALFRHLTLGRPRSNLKAWLFQVGHNLALKQRNRSIRRSATEVLWSTDLEDTITDPAANPEELLADRQTQARVQLLLLELCERDRQCLFLRAEGLTYREIARTLHISLGSVAKSVARGLTHLARLD